MKGTFSRNLPKVQIHSSGSAPSAAKNSSSLNKSRENNHNALSKSSLSDSSESFEEINHKWNLLKLKNQAELTKSKQLNSVHEFDSSSPSKDGGSQDS